MRTAVTLFAALLLAPALIAAAPDRAAAHSAEVQGIKIGHAWAPPTGSAAGAIYMPILNGRNGDVTLAGASTPVAEEVYLRSGKNENAERLDSLTLQPNQPLALAAWRAHLWMTGLKRTLEAGQHFPLTLTFEPGGSVEIDVVVQSAPGH